MYYIDAIELVKLSVKHGVLATHTQTDPSSGVQVSGIVVYIEGSDIPELWEEDYMAHVLMEDPEGEVALIAALRGKGIEFARVEGSSRDNAMKSLLNSEK